MGLAIQIMDDNEKHKPIVEGLRVTSIDDEPAIGIPVLLYLLYSNDDENLCGDRLNS